jgi:hypothetical protein
MALVNVRYTLGTYSKSNYDYIDSFQVMRGTIFCTGFLIFLTRFEKGNQIKGKGLFFRSGAQMHGSVSVARLLGTYNFIR